jgi:outer membrane immunogenic protein
MRKVLFGWVGATAMSLSAPTLAADLAAQPYMKAPAPVIAAIYDWSGFYIGLNGGGGTSHKCWDNYVAGALVAGEGCHNATGGSVGGQVGFRWQSSNWVFGIEGQGNWADLSGENVSTAFTALAQRNRTRIDSFGLITGQFGYAWNNVLLYVKGGGAVVRDKYDVYAAPGNVVFATDTLIASARDARWGATVGAGFEIGFAPNWTVGVEYDHIFLDSRTLALTTVGGIVFKTDRITQDVDIGLVRLNYRFGGPLMAKY